MLSRKSEIIFFSKKVVSNYRTTYGNPSVRRTGKTFISGKVQQCTLLCRSSAATCRIEIDTSLFFFLKSCRFEVEKSKTTTETTTMVPSIDRPVCAYSVACISIHTHAHICSKNASDKRLSGSFVGR